MRTLIFVIGYISIIVLIVPSMVFLAGKMSLDRVKMIMLVATVVWFGANVILTWNLDKMLMGKRN